MLISSKSVHPDMHKESLMHTGIGLWIGHRKAVIVDIETADKMTDRQVAAVVLLSAGSLTSFTCQDQCLCPRH